MDMVDFYPKTFQEIPDQDNPAFGTHECYMIVKESEHCPHSVILHISEENLAEGDAVVHVAKFWRHEKALQYCEEIAD